MMITESPGWVYMFTDQYSAATTPGDTRIHSFFNWYPWWSFSQSITAS